MVPILFQLGPITIYSYGFFLTLAYIVGTFIFWREGQRQGYQGEKLLDLSLIGLLAALVGGRLYFALFNFDLVQKNPLSAIAFWEGGLSFYGALFGVLIAGFILTKRWKWPFFQVADFAALAGLAALAVGKIGTFFAGVSYGTTTNLPWAVEFPNLLGARHPVQFYEAAAVLVLLFFFKNLYEKGLVSKEVKSGRVFLWAVFSVASTRFFFEFFRADSYYIFGVKEAQIVSFLVAAAALFALYYLRLRSLQEDFENSLKFILSVNRRVLRRLGILPKWN